MSDRFEFRLPPEEKVRWQDYARGIGWSCGHLVREAVTQLIDRGWMPELPAVEPTILGRPAGDVERELRERGWIGDDE